jgi:hypothetical protein
MRACIAGLCGRHPHLLPQLAAVLLHVHAAQLYRGVLLALLAGALGNPLSIAGIRIGCGALPVIAFFGLAHGLTQAHSTDTIASIVAATVMGAGLVWLKERTSSIWVTVIVHNLANNGSSFFNALPKAA